MGDRLGHVGSRPLTARRPTGSMRRKRRRRLVPCPLQLKSRASVPHSPAGERGSARELLRRRTASQLVTEIADAIEGNFFTA